MQDLDDIARHHPQVPYVRGARRPRWAVEAIERAEAEHGPVMVRRDGYRFVPVTDAELRARPELRAES